MASGATLRLLLKNSARCRNRSASQGMGKMQPAVRLASIGHEGLKLPVLVPSTLLSFAFVLLWQQKGGKKGTI